MKKILKLKYLTPLFLTSIIPFFPCLSKGFFSLTQIQRLNEPRMEGISDQYFSLSISGDREKLQRRSKARVKVYQKHFVYLFFKVKNGVIRDYHMSNFTRSRLRPTIASAYTLSGIKTSGGCPPPGRARVKHKCVLCSNRYQAQYIQSLKFSRWCVLPNSYKLFLFYSTPYRTPSPWLCDSV